ncbi:MAG: hypothetical protein NZ693_08080 [Thermoflexales bacterium]|nr:hypothetical protein [Thermoflexales bacterium]
MSASPLTKTVRPSLAHEGIAALLAVAGGAAAGSRFAASPGWELGFALGTVVALSWQVLWHALAAPDWRAILAIWQGWAQGRPLPYLPYTQPGSLAERAAVELGLFAAWARRALLPAHGETLITAAISAGTALAVSAALNEWAVVLTFTALLFAQLALLLGSQFEHLQMALRGLQTVTLPLVLGHSLMAELGLAFLAVALALGIAYGGLLGSQALLHNAGCVVVVLLLVLTRQPVGAFTVLTLWAAQALLKLERGHRVWLLAVILASALTFAA